MPNLSSSVLCKYHKHEEKRKTILKSRPVKPRLIYEIYLFLRFKCLLIKKYSFAFAFVRSVLFFMMCIKICVYSMKFEVIEDLTPPVPTPSKFEEYEKRRVRVQCR